MYLHLYHNDADDKEHLAMVFGNTIVSRSLNSPQSSDTPANQTLRGADMTRSQSGAASDRIEIEKALQLVDGPPPLVRVHSECFTGETSWSVRCDCGDRINKAADMICRSPSESGAIIYLRQEGRGIGLANKLRAYNLQDTGLDTVEANISLGLAVDSRSYGVATAILCDLGLDGEPGIRLLTNNPDKVSGITGPEGEVKVQEVVDMSPSACGTFFRNSRNVFSHELNSYLRTKVEKFGHTIRM